MESASALLGRAQVSVHCTECNSLLTRWMDQVTVVDESIITFRQDLLSLQVAFDRTVDSLKDRAVAHAGDTTDRYAGGRLWSQLAGIMNAVEKTLISVRQTLQSIELGSRRVPSMVKDLAQALEIGEMVASKQLVKLFEQVLTLPLAMISVSMLIQNPYLHDDSVDQIRYELKGLRSEHGVLKSTLGSFSLKPSGLDDRSLRDIEDYLSTILFFISNVASMVEDCATNKLPLHDVLVTGQNANAQQKFLTEDSDREQILRPLAFRANETCNKSISSQTQSEHSDRPSIASSTSTHSTGATSIAADDSIVDDEIELELYQEYMANGQADFDIDDFDAAEANFRQALRVCQDNVFSKRLQYGIGDINYMLAECFIKQEKQEDALRMLQELADNKSELGRAVGDGSKSGPEPQKSLRELQYKASHLLAVIFLNNNAHEAAEKRAKEAFKGRRRLLGQNDIATLESVQLLIDIYTAKDDKVNARAYRRFLEPPARSEKRAVSLNRALTTMAKNSPGRQNHPYDDLTISAVISHSTPSDKSPILLAKRPATAIPSPNMIPAPLVTRRSTVSPRNSKASSSPRNSFSPALTDSQTSELMYLPATTYQASVTIKGNDSPHAIDENVSQTPPSPSQPEGIKTSAANRKLSQIQEDVAAPKAQIRTRPKVNPSFDPVDPAMVLFPSSIKPPCTNVRDQRSVASVIVSDLSIATPLKKPANATVSRSHSRKSSHRSSLSNITFTDLTRHVNMNGPWASDSKGDLIKMMDYLDRNDTFSTKSPRSPTLPSLGNKRSRQDLLGIFTSIRSLRAEGKKSAAFDVAMSLFREYDPDRSILRYRENELRKNLRESFKGLAGTGHGYAPIHFFCECQVETSTEIELLVEQGVDVNAVAHRVTPYSEPFTPLEVAIELNHPETVRALIAANVSFSAPKPPKSLFSLSTRERLNIPLLIAVARGHSEVALMLLAAGAGAQVKEIPQCLWHGTSLLHEACWQSNVPLLKMLLQYSKTLRNSPTSPSAEHERKIIGTPCQQDMFGATPIMYVVDLRHCTDTHMRQQKIRHRKECLRLLLEHSGDLSSHMFRDRAAEMLSLQWTRGPSQGHSVFCYIEATGDDELRSVLEPFRNSVNVDMRCSADPQCAQTLRMNGMSEKSVGMSPRVAEFPDLSRIESDRSEGRSILGSLLMDSGSFDSVHDLRRSRSKASTNASVSSRGTHRAGPRWNGKKPIWSDMFNVL